MRLLCAFFYRRNSVFVVVHLAIGAFQRRFLCRVSYRAFASTPPRHLLSFAIFCPAGQPPRKADKPAKASQSVTLFQSASFCLLCHHTPLRSTIFFITVADRRSSTTRPHFLHVYRSIGGKLANWMCFISPPQALHRYIPSSPQSVNFFRVRMPFSTNNAEEHPVLQILPLTARSAFPAPVLPRPNTG